MAHLIDKDAVVAEIERLKERFIASHHRDGNDWPLDNYGKMRAYNEVLSFLDTLEVKEVRISIPNIDDTLKEEGLDPDSKEAKAFKESYYLALEKLKAQKGE